MKKKFYLKYSTKRKINGFLFVLPFLIGFFIFFAVPLWNTFLYSLNSISVKDNGGMEFTYVGLQNYVDLFQTEVTTEFATFAQLFADQNVNILTNAPLIVVFSLFLSLLANRKFRGRGVVRVIFFLPIVLGIQVVIDMLAVTTGSEAVTADTGLFDESIVFELLFRFTNLSENMIISITGFVSNIFNIISQSGVQTLIYLAALQSISPSLYEVSKIEGATSYETFWKVTLPSIMHITLFVVVYTIVDLFLKSPIADEAYSFAFKQSKIGTGSALSIVYIFNVLAALGLVLLVLGKVVKKYDK